jgi:DNA-binding CsgD family transcriptional regulator
MQIDEFTKREREVAGLLALGRTNKEIARSLFISVETVKEHVHHCLRRSRARSRVQFAIWWTLKDLQSRPFPADPDAMRRAIAGDLVAIEAEFSPAKAAEGVASV